MKLILFLLLIVVFSSCGVNTGYRAKQLETGTTMIIQSEWRNYQAGDSVWVDSTNTINSQATNAMLCVILK